MIRATLARLKQKHRTVAFPRTEPVLPARFRGRPVFGDQSCDEGCCRCSESCPTGAIAVEKQRPVIDLGRCLFCNDCVEACPRACLSFSNNYELAARGRKDLLVSAAHPLPDLAPLGNRLRRLLGRSLKLRQVSAGGCAACEADVNVLGTVVFDLSRFGVQFVASPRHADGLLVTGPVTKNMELALRKTYDAVPGPKIVIALGACAISGGLYRGHTEANNGVDGILPVDLWIPGCPPSPYTTLSAILRMLGRR